MGGQQFKASMGVKIATEGKDSSLIGGGSYKAPANKLTREQYMRITKRISFGGQSLRKSVPAPVD